MTSHAHSGCSDFSKRAANNQKCFDVLRPLRSFPLTEPINSSVTGDHCSFDLASVSRSLRLKNPQICLPLGLLCHLRLQYRSSRTCAEGQASPILSEGLQERVYTPRLCSPALVEGDTSPHTSKARVLGDAMRTCNSTTAALCLRSGKSSRLHWILDSVVTAAICSND